MNTKNGAAASVQSLIYVHVPKAAGSSLNTVINRQYPRRAIHTIEGSNVQASIEAFKQLPTSQRETIQCLKGHMRFGLHEYMPQPCVYFSMLRDPVERVLSTYYFILRRPGHYMYERVVGGNVTLEAYVASRMAVIAHNGQTRIFAGLPVDQDEDPPPDLLERAKRNLRQHFVVVGLVERFDESLILMKRRLGWHSVYYVRRNVTRDRPNRADLPASTIRLIEQANELDMELYTFVEELLADSLRQEGPALQREVRRLQTVNGLLSAAWAGLGWVGLRKTVLKVRVALRPGARRQ
jgi:hypothetical protein